MKYFILLISVGLAFAEIKEEKDVLVLTKDNFDEAVNDQANIMVEFCMYYLNLFFILICNLFLQKRSFLFLFFFLLRLFRLIQYTSFFFFLDSVTFCIKRPKFVFNHYVSCTRFDYQLNSNVCIGKCMNSENALWLECIY